MSEERKVDVAAVLNWADRQLRGGKDEFSPDSYMIGELRSAASNIAELIAASYTLTVHGDGRGYFESGEACNRFRKALAACLPEKQP